MNSLTMERRPATSRRRGGGSPVARAFAVAILTYACLNLALFASPLYRPMLAPDSTTGSFERALAALKAEQADPARDVLVLGDSRIYEGLVPAVASTASGGRFRFVRAAVPGTTPRCWRFLAAAIDPATTRYRALVIPVDTLGDDDSALGSVDGDDRETDLQYFVYELSPSAILGVAGSFSGPVARARIAFDLFLRGPLLGADLRALLADPAARARALATAAPYDLSTARAALRSPLGGLRADFARDALAFTPDIPPDERAELDRQILLVPSPSPTYARYRREWLGPLVAAYLAAHKPVVVVRIPARPIHRRASDPVSGTIAEWRAAGAVVVSATAYLALERPRFFRDHDHLDRAGALRFSDLLGRDVGRAIQP